LVDLGSATPEGVSIRTPSPTPVNERHTVTDNIINIPGLDEMVISSSGARPLINYIEETR
jgi:hypothetical protein